MEKLNSNFFVVLLNAFFSVSFLFIYLVIFVSTYFVSTYFVSTYFVSTLVKVLICGLGALKRIIEKTQCKNYAKRPALKLGHTWSFVPRVLKFSPVPRI